MNNPTNDPFKDELLKQNGINHESAEQSFRDHIRERMGLQNKKIQTAWMRTLLIWVLAIGSLFVMYLSMPKVSSEPSGVFFSSPISLWDSLAVEFNRFPFFGWWVVLFVVLAMVQTFLLITMLHQQRQDEMAIQGQQQSRLAFHTAFEQRNKALIHMRWISLSLWIIAIVLTVFLLVNRPGGLYQPFGGEYGPFYLLLLTICNWIWIAAIISSILLFFRKRSLTHHQMQDRLNKIEAMLEQIVKQQQK